MNYETDLYLKDEGDIMTVCFQTPKAIDVLNKENKDAVWLNVYGNDSYKKLDVDITLVDFFINYAKSHDLTIQSEI